MTPSKFVIPGFLMRNTLRWRAYLQKATWEGVVLPRFCPFASGPSCQQFPLLVRPGGFQTLSFAQSLGWVTWPLNSVCDLRVRCQQVRSRLSRLAITRYRTALPALFLAQPIYLFLTTHGLLWLPSLPMLALLLLWPKSDR
jgi:hypothetical protein